MDKSQYLSKVSGPALVFGAGGIGTEIVRAFVASGASAVAFTYNKNQAAAEALKSEVEALGARAFIGSVDLMDTDALTVFLDKAAEAFGEEITTVVNTVGISPNTPLPDQTPEEWRQVYEVNVFGPFFSSRLIASRMKKHGVKGSITLITSTNGINSQSSISAHYDSSKAAQAHMMRIIAEEYAPAGIRINGVAPGWINTKMNDTLPEDEREKEMAKIWSGRFAEPAEVAKLVVFVASSGGSYIYGQNLMIDGGYR
jgi:3-oxoacyl-[acyl-carrier protein] reductase